MNFKNDGIKKKGEMPFLLASMAVVIILIVLSCVMKHRPIINQKNQSDN